MHGPHEVRTVCALVRGVGGLHLITQTSACSLVGQFAQGVLHHAVFKILRVGKVHRLHEAPLPPGCPHAAGDSGIERLLRRRTHRAFVVVQAHDLIELAGVDRLDQKSVV